MKFLTILLVAAVVAGAYAVTDSQKKKAEEHVKACIHEGKVDPELVKKLRGGDFSSHDEKLQCFAKCFFEKAGFMDASGNLHEDVAKAKLSEGAKDKEAVNKLVDLCKTEKGANACETAYKMYICVHKNKHQ